MALTQTDLDALDAAIVSAELEVKLEGRLVKYKSTDELLKARAYAAGVVNAGANKRVSYGYAFKTQRDL